MSSKRKLQVFVSSTYRDLLIERQAAVEAILKAGHIPAGMELFAAGNQSQLEIIRQWIDESDTYMLILGGRYGSVDPATGVSYTELEYDYAVSQDKPVFSVVIEEEALNRRVKAAGAEVLEREYPQQLKLFREKVLKRICSFFSDPKDIKLAIHETLSDFLKRYEFRGWVPGDEVAQLSTLLEELSHLRQQNKELERELDELKKSDRGKRQSKASDKYAAEELEEILAILNSIEIETTAFNEKGNDKPNRFNLLKVVTTMRDSLITGVRNNLGIGSVASLLFYNVFPKLAVYGLASIEKVNAKGLQRFRLTPKGLALLAYWDKKQAPKPTAKEK